MARPSRGILVTGGGSFLGDNIAAALRAQGAGVSLLVRPGAEDKLGSLAPQIRWSTAVCGARPACAARRAFIRWLFTLSAACGADPTQGLSFHQLNLFQRATWPICASVMASSA